MPQESEVIREPYLIICPSPCYQSADNKHYVDPLWAKDLREHFPYLKNLRLAAPLVERADVSGMECVEPGGDVEFEHIDLPYNPSLLKALLTLPKTALTLWRAIGRASIVHSDILNGWPYSYGWLAVPMAMLRGKFTIAFVESTDIQTAPKNGKLTLWQRIKLSYSERLARFCARRVQMAFVGYHEVAEKYFSERSERCHVAPFIWLLPEELCSEDQARGIWRKKSRAEEELRLLIVVRLVASKGLHILFDAMKELERRGVRVRLDIFGMGPEEALCREAADRPAESAKVYFHGALKYGAPLFDELRKAHMLVQPLLSGEQPRIIFDAFSQALPVLASDTDGLRMHVKDRENGRIVEVGNVQDLADKIQEISEDPSSLESMGMAGLAYSRDLTLPATHRRRAKQIIEAFIALRRTQ